MKGAPPAKTHLDETRPRALLRRVANVLLCLMAFYLGVHTIGNFDSKSGSRLPQQKLAQFLERKDDYDVLFVGSSLVFRHIIPSRFDSLTAAGGHPTTSYNLGVPAFTFFEIYHQIRQVLGSNPARLEWIILDVGFVWKFARFNVRTVRFIDWHGVPETLMAVMHALVREEPEASNIDAINQKNRLINQHLEAAFTKGAHRGRGLTIVKNLLGFESGSASNARALQRLAQGYVSLEDSPDASYRNTHFLEHIEEYEQSLAGGVQPELRPMPAYEHAIVGRLVDMIESNNIELMFICGPILGERIECRDGTAVSSNPHPMFLYNDSERYPMLYRADRRFDRMHLNELGAQEFTAILAADFLAVLESQRH